MTNFERVRKYMETFGQEIKEKAEFPSQKIKAKPASFACALGAAQILGQDQ